MKNWYGTGYNDRMRVVDSKSAVDDTEESDDEAAWEADDMEWYTAQA